MNSEDSELSDIVRDYIVRKLDNADGRLPDPDLLPGRLQGSPEWIADSKWEVHAKGGPNRRSFEIAVIRAENHFGKSSYGWFDETKLLISHSGGPCQDHVTKVVWEKLVECARRVADELNKAEGRG